jgi:predicted MPP superfamily phosphohydrolase
MTISRRKFLKMSLASVVTTAVGGIGGFAYAHDIETGWIEVVSLDLTLPRLSPAFDGYKLVQFSDIHVDGGKTNDHLKRVVELVNAQQPDAIAITGDFVTHTSAGGIASALVDPLSQLSPKDITVAILGNHDHWTDPEGVRLVLRKSGITDLSNTVYTIERDGEVLHLAGVDDYWERMDRMDEVLARLPDDGAAVLLAHEPDYADISSATGRFDLQISGHSHGGQVIFPFIGPLVLPAYGKKYPLGRYQVGNMIQYTNRGVGTVSPAVRFNCRPEITVFNLHSNSPTTA